MTDVETVNLLVKNWTKNREIDELRVKEICTHLNNGGWVPPILYVANVPTEGLVCYDGNHRRSAYRMSSPQHDQKPVILDVLQNHRDIYSAFNNVNRSVPLAMIDLKMDTNLSNVKVEIESLVKEFEKQHPQLVSTSRRPNAPNFNRDNVKDQLFGFLEEIDLTISVQTLKEALKLLNTAYAEGLRPGSEHCRLKPKVLDKCTKSKMWLFAFRREILETDLKWAIERYEETKEDLIKFE